MNHQTGAPKCPRRKGPMQITAIEMKKKIEELEQRKASVVAEANMLAGAIDCCKYWLSELLRDEEKPAEPAESGAPDDCQPRRAGGDAPGG